MRKFILAAAFFLMSLCFADNSSAGNFGLVGGANFHTYNPKDIGSQTLTQWHGGMIFKFGLPLGFQIQPALTYSVKDAVTETSKLDLSVGYLELMTSVQWGADLILFRPFLDVSPFVGYSVNGWGNLWSEGANGLEYGVGLGGGLQIWRFQVTARYNWNFGYVLPDGTEKLKGADFSGVSLSLAYFF